MNKLFTPKRLKTTAFAAATLLAASCMPEDDFQDIEVLAPSPSLSLPILNTNLKVSDLIRTDDGGLLEENSDNSYSLFYRQNIQSQPVGAYFPPIPDQQYDESFSLGISAPAFNWSPEPVTVDGKIPMNTGDLALYGIECKSGALQISMSSDYDHNISIILTLLDLVDANQEPMVFEFDLVWGNRYSVQSKELAGYMLNIDNEEIRYTMEIGISGSGNAINSYEQIYMGLNMSDIDFSFLKGNFSNITIPVKADTLEIPFLANAINGEVALNPNFKVDFVNSFGVPVSPDLSNIYVERNSGNVRLQDEGDSEFFSGNFEFPYLQDRNDLPAVKSQLVDENNSNLEDAFAELPRGIAYWFGFTMNSGEQDTSFVTDESMIGVDLEVELPLEGRFDVLLEDTIDVDLDFEQEVEELKVLIKTENEFPIDAGLQVFFLDAEGNRLYDTSGEPIKLFADEAKFLEAAQITNSSTGETKATSIDMPISATISQEKYELIKQAGSILIQAGLKSKSEEEDRIRLYSFYNIRFSMAMQVKSSLNISN
ncbi:hypothetical protein PZB74_04020 [Porifericola rhodea]|uniref:hypothetical protein n=1 Tax=Porifericola rhodea TaxID=930972 RepID=UPI002665EB22|nr:hypothetical protein [Porifericola rhodea]WKN32512.1 hypothetical protein PZB74_04020 [Porifericola rhodea]